jgi:hypothetical protein
MKTISWYPPRSPRGMNPNILHVEAEGCIVNVEVGLTDANGRRITCVTVIPDHQTGGEWDADGMTGVRVIERMPQ